MGVISDGWSSSFVFFFGFDFKWTASHLIAPLLPPYQANQVKCVYQAVYGQRVSWTVV